VMAYNRVQILHERHRHIPQTQRRRGTARHASSHKVIPVRTRRSSVRSSRPCPTISPTKRDTVGNGRPLRRASVDTVSVGARESNSSRMRSTRESTDSPLEHRAISPNLRRTATCQ
jgi:hypothetical protein